MSGILSKLGATPKSPKSKSETLSLDTPEAAQAAEAWIKAKREEQAAKASLELALGQLLPQARKAWLDQNRGRTSPLSSVEVKTPIGAALVSFAAQWFPKSAEAVASLPDDLKVELFDIALALDKLGAATPEFAQALFALAQAHDCLPAVSLSIDGTKVPAQSAGAFVDSLLELAARMGVGDAVHAEGKVIPHPTFNEVRHARFTPAQNEQLEAAGLGTRVSVRQR